jgi:hypothetical protein
MMADKRLFSMAGATGGANEPLTLHFSKLTLSEALVKMLRGYSYVLVDEGKGRLPVLTVMGKTQRTTPAPEKAGTDPTPGNRAEQRAGGRPEPAPPPPDVAMPPVQPRPPLAPPQPQNNQQPAAQQAQQGGQAQAAQQQAAVPAAPYGTGQQPIVQPGQAPTGQAQPGQQAPIGQQSPSAPAQPPEPEGVHF